MTVTNREALYANILEEVITNLKSRSRTRYEVDENMELWERPAGQLLIDASHFDWSDHEDTLAMVCPDFHSEDPLDIRDEIIRIFYIEDTEVTPDLINDAIDELAKNDDAELKMS